MAKSGIMLGLGRLKMKSSNMDDLLAVNCQTVTLGQYLQPTRQISGAGIITPENLNLINK